MKASSLASKEISHHKFKKLKKEDKEKQNLFFPKN